MPLPSTADSTDSTGTKLEVKSNLKTETRAISSVSQALAVAQRLVDDAAKLIRNAARVTKKINGERPRSDRGDANKAKNHKANVNTGVLATACSKIPPRFYMPLKSARYLVAGGLPPHIEGAGPKSERFREKVTRAIRSWNKWHFFLQGLAYEVGVYGYAFPAFFDQYDWRPKLIRQDEGFMPVGTELLDSDVPFFVVKWSYRPDELLALAKAGAWNKDHVAKAISAALPKSQSSISENIRAYADLVRESAVGLSYQKGAKLIETQHLFAKESTGKVPHYILWVDGATKNDSRPLLSSGDEMSGDSDERLLYEKLDRFESMDEITSAMVFQYGNGTLQGSLGAGHILYDMSNQVELTRNESFDNLRMTNRLKLVTSDGKDMNQVKATIYDEKIIVSNAQFAAPGASMPVAVDGFIALDRQMTQLMEEKVGAFLPPAIVPGSNPTATQVNVQTMREEEIRNAMLDNWLTQFATLTYMMTKRLCDPKSPHKEAKALLKELKEFLSTEEIELLVKDCALQNILEFTEIVAQRRAQFAVSVRNNMYYDQAAVERVIAESAVGSQIAQMLMIPKADQNVVAEAQRQQLVENSAMLDLQEVPVLPRDNDYIHMETMKKPLIAMLQQGNVMVAEVGLRHYIAHYEQWIKKKGEPRDKKNAEKKLIRSMELALQSLKEKQQLEANVEAMNSGAPGLAEAAGGVVPPAQLSAVG